jgi:hypothetical protein
MSSSSLAGDADGDGRPDRVYVEHGPRRTEYRAVDPE